MERFISPLPLLMIIPFLGMFFAMFSKGEDANPNRNVFNVGLFTIVVNIIFVIIAFTMIDINTKGLQLVEKYTWFASPNVEVVMGVDTFSMLILFSIQVAFLIGYIGIRGIEQNQKPIIIFSLLYLSLLNGFFMSNDIFSFYFFFEAMLLPLLMLIGQFGGVKRIQGLYRFFIYNFIGALIIFVAFLLIYHTQGKIYEISALSKLQMKRPTEIMIWLAIFIALLSRIPIWPFHYWISSICSNIKNPLVFILANIVPLTGIYGFIRFLPNMIPYEMSIYVYVIELVALITMFFISLIGFSNKDAQYKLFSYATVYYLMYLLGILSRNPTIMFNVGLSFLGYLIAISAVEVLTQYIDRKMEDCNSLSDGFLCSVPRLSFVYSLLALICIGMPMSTMFFDNFLIIGNLSQSSVWVSIGVVFCLLIVSISILQEYFKLHDDNKSCTCFDKSQDISEAAFYFMLLVVFMLVMSFFRPFWFVGG